MDLLNKYKVHVGVSIDGTKEHNDKYRVDHYGNGSYDAVVKGIKLLQENLFSKPGCLTVVNPEFDSRLVYRHLIDLGFRSLDFLLPDNSYVNPPPYPIEQYTEYFINLFDEWAKDDNVEFKIRKFNSMMGQLVGKRSFIYGFGSYKSEVPLLAIRSDGGISPTDELSSTDPDTVSFTGGNVKNTTLKEIIDRPIFHELAEAVAIIPNKCKNCCWYSACGGGNFLSRFSVENRFNNHSIYCDRIYSLQCLRMLN